jgi:heme-degrading monooxygenase HmoA
MAFITADDGYLTAINLFETDTLEGQDRLFEAMREITDAAAYPGWISTSLHTGRDRLGTANYMQWRSLEDLAARYAGDDFGRHTLPLFKELATSMKRVQAEVVLAQRHPALGDGAVEISADRNDYTFISVVEVSPQDQAALVDAMTQPAEWLLTVPGYRSHSVLRSIDGTSVVTYSQWDDQESHDAFQELPEAKRPPGAQQAAAAVRSLATSQTSNAYRVVYTRAAGA